MKYKEWWLIIGFIAFVVCVAVMFGNATIPVK